MPHSESVLPLGVPIAPTEPSDVNSTHIAEYGRGGLHSVADLTARANIATDRKRVGMLVYVQSESKYYTLTALPNTWAELSAAAAIPDGSITTAKLGGDITAAGKALLDDADAAAQRTTLGLGTVATQDASAIALTGGTMSGVSVNSGSYSALANEALVRIVRKASAGTITKGQVVYVTGSQGTHLTVELASASSELTAAPTIGIALENITSSTDGYMIVSGLVQGLSNLPVASFTDGAALWLSTTAGGWTTTRPTQPNHGVFLGWVISASNGGSGRAFIKVINGQELDELHDVLLSGKAEKDLFSYDATAGVWKNRTIAAAGLAAASHGHSVGDISGLGGMATLGSTAAGDLSGTWPNITVQKVQGNTFDGGTPGDGDVWQYQVGANRWTHTSFIDLLSYNDIGWDGSTFSVDAILTASVTFPSFGESITNPVNGRIDFTPAPSASTAWKFYVDMTSFNVGVRLGVIRTSDNAVNPAGSYIVFDTTAQIATDKSLSFHSNDWMQLRGTSQGNDTAQLSVLVNNAGSSGAFALVDLGSIGTTNRSPTVNHIDPHLYVYSADTNEANDFVRLSHNRTDALIEAGNGKLRLKGASVVRIEGPSGGFDLPANAGSNGQVLTTDGTNASWQTSTGGGGVSEEDALALAVAL